MTRKNSEFIMMMSVFRTSDSEGDMGVSSGRHARHYTRYTWALKTAFFPQVHNDDEVRALFMLLSNSSNCVFRTSDSEGDMGVSSGRHARHYTRYTWVLETAFFPQLYHKCTITRTNSLSLLKGTLYKSFSLFYEMGK
ncbi:uncharacterized protein [Arachis hypogaea]|uniref:uncharacterized protein isoform X9 n=1 Tax=Arachis hypogaea TaxID=3818 RepID=UPI003B226B11